MKMHDMMSKVILQRSVRAVPPHHHPFNVHSEGHLKPARTRHKEAKEEVEKKEGESDSKCCYRVF